MSTPGSPTSGIAELPWEVLDYVSWARQQPASAEARGGYLFDEPALRFGVDDSDVLVLAPELRVDVAEPVRLASARLPNHGVALEGVSAGQAGAISALLGQIDGVRALGELRWRAGESRPLLEALLRSAFGKLVFAPFAIAAAEARVPGADITRFPGSPYEIHRAYWTNMGAVRARVGELAGPLSSDDSFRGWLRELHGLALMGEDLQTYYLPASPIGAARAAPGRWMLSGTTLVDTPLGTWIARGPRVSAAQPGGTGYHEALYATVSEPEAASPRSFTDAAGTSWGRLVSGRADADAGVRDWFCPPRPMSGAHFGALRGALAQALVALGRNDRSACVLSLAAFHQAFIRLHPFHCGNQSLAMNIVNAVLGKLLGSGIPHLVLDHLALRLSPAAYGRVFERAVAGHVRPHASIAARYAWLASSRTRTFELAAHLSNARSEEERAAVLRSDESTARLLLLVDP